MKDEVRLEFPIMSIVIENSNSSKRILKSLAFKEFSVVFFSESFTKRETIQRLVLVQHVASTAHQPKFISLRVFRINYRHFSSLLSIQLHALLNLEIEP